jgi:hypothetical protein
MARRGLAAPAAIVAALIAPAGASALTEVSVKGAHVGSGVYAGTAPCPTGKHPVSGGFTSSVGAYASVNKATANGWRVQALNTASLTVYAFCSGRLEPNRAAGSATFPRNSSGVERTAKATCRRGRAVAGGWAFTPGGLAALNQPVFKSRPQGTDKWAVTAFNNDSGASPRERIKAFAYCLRGPRRVKSRRASWRRLHNQPEIRLREQDRARSLLRRVHPDGPDHVERLRP